MAEGGLQTTILDGSDADITIACTPCSEEGTREEAVKYCPDCDEYLCTTCKKYHLKMKATRDHKLVDKEEGRNEANVAKTTVKIKCRQHPDRDIEMFCGTHDMVYCLMCIATDHRSCSDVTSLKDTTYSIFQQTYIERLQEESKSMKERLVASEKMKEENIVLVEEKRNNIQERVKEMEDDMIQHIRTLSKQANDSLNETYTLVKCDLESGIAMLSRGISEMEKVNGQLLESSAGANLEQRFVQVKLCEQMINDAKNVNDKFESDGKITIEFVENAGVTGHLLEIKTLGTIEKSRVNGKRKITRQKEINVRIPNDQQTCRIIDMCQIDSGTFILVDSYNNKIKLLDINHSETDYVSLGDEPTGICRKSHNEIAVVMSNYKVKLFSVRTRITTVRNIPIKQDKRYCGIAYTAGKFWLATESGVDVYDINGTRQQSVTNDTTGRQIFQSTPQQMTAYQNLVFVADYSGSIVCLASDGTKKAEFRDRKLRSAIGVCISRDGTIYAVDERSKTIVMFNKDGKCVGELAPEVPSEKVPMSLCYNDKNDCLLIGYLSSDTVSVCYLSD